MDPEFSGWWEMTDRIEELFNVPSKIRDHDHNSTNDAYTIAYDFLVLLGIKERTISLKKMPKHTKKKLFVRVILRRVPSAP